MNINVKNLLSGLTHQELLNLLSAIAELLNNSSSSNDNNEYYYRVHEKDYSQYE